MLDLWRAEPGDFNTFKRIEKKVGIEEFKARLRISGDKIGQ